MRSEIILALLGFCILFRGAEPRNECPAVKIQVNSTIYLGCEILNWKGEQCAAFRGIPYAKPPVGERRFKDPEPIEDVPDIVDAQEDGEDCPSIFSNNTSEDCLFLNVYSKHLDSRAFLKPVIVFIHPGGFYVGKGSSNFIGPEYILQENIVLVTFNYRLSSLGFLNLGTREIPGNAGLKDQVMALRWVKNNIQHFGGDPNNISLMGYSAGGFSVTLHLVSPMSQGLFHKAIIMSGVVPPQTKIPSKDQLELARKQAFVMGCGEKVFHPREIVECLSKFSGQEIAAALRRMFHFGKDNPIYLWLPIVEEDFGQERFLIESPYTSFKAGRFARVPILTGFTNGEFCTSAKDIINSEQLSTELNYRFGFLAPICFMYSDHEHEDDITRGILSNYLRNRTINEGSFNQLCNLFSDSLIRFGTQKFADLVSKYVDVFRYRFSYRGRFSNLNYGGYDAAEHMDDLMYLFNLPPNKFTQNDPEAEVVNLVTKAFTNFAKSGKFVDNFESGMRQFAEINLKIDVRNDTYFDKFDFWNKFTDF